MPRSFTFATITEYKAAKGNSGAIYAELVSSGIKSGSCVSKITATGDVFIDSINPFVTPELGQEGDTLYYNSSEDTYRFLRAGNTTWDTDSYGQVYIDLAKIPSGFSVVAPYTDIFNYKQTDESIGSGKASMTKILGNTVAWNQIQAVSSTDRSTSSDGITITDNRDGSYTLNGKATADFRMNFPNFSINGYSHKILITGIAGGGTNTYYFGAGGAGFGGWLKSGVPVVLVSPSNYKAGAININVKNGVTVNNVVLRPQMVDLTHLYGSAIDGMTDAQILAKFESEFPGYHSYNAGQLISNKAKAIEFVGFNQWDGTYEAKKLFREGGVIEDNEAYFITGYIPALPNTEYYVRKAYGSQTYLCFYDANYNFIGNVKHSGGYALRVTSPANTAFIRDCCQNGYDYCISLSGPRNGQYEPYKKTTLQVPITALRGKLNGQGNSVNIFPDGLKSAGDVYDEIGNGYAVKRVGVVDLGTLTVSGNSITRRYFTDHYYFDVTIPDRANSLRNQLSSLFTNSTLTTDIQETMDNHCMIGRGSNYRIYFRYDEADSPAGFVNAMSGVMLYYELETPEYYVLDREFNFKYRTSPYHTKKMLPENGEEPTSAPFACEIKQI